MSKRMLGVRFPGKFPRDEMLRKFEELIVPVNEDMNTWYAENVDNNCFTMRSFENGICKELAKKKVELSEIDGYIDTYVYMPKMVIRKGGIEYDI